jgi:hypothetical protein
VSLDLSHVQWRPRPGSIDEQVDNGTNRVLAEQIVVQPQVINPLALQLTQQPEGFR